MLGGVRPLPMVGGMLDTVVRALGRSDLFGALNEEQLRKVANRAALLQASDEEVIVAAGDAADAFFLVLSGAVTVHTEHAGVQISRVGPDDVVGEMAVLLGVPRTATVVADGPAVLLEFDANVFDAMFERIPGFGMAISRGLARRLEAATRKLGA